MSEQPPASPISVSVLVLNHNGAPLLTAGLPSVIAAAEHYDGPAEVVVIDNDSTDQSLSVMAEHFPDVRVIGRPNRVLASYNDVAPDLDSDALLLLNNDIRLTPDAIGAMARVMTEDTFSVTGAIYLDDERTYQAGRYALRRIHGLLRFDPNVPQRAGDTAYGPGGASLVRRTSFVDLGGFDPVFLPAYLEDADLGLRAWACGMRCVFEPSARLFHRGSATLGTMFDDRERLRLWLRNEIILSRKHAGHRATSWDGVRVLASPFKGRSGAVVGAYRDAAHAVVAPMPRDPVALGQLLERLSPAALAR